MAGLPIAMTDLKKHSLTLCFFMSALIIATPSQAQALELSVAPFINYFHYQEFDDKGEELLNEVGPLYGIELALAGEVGRVQSTVELSYLIGEVDYQGRTQAGNPYNTKTQQNIIQYGASLGYRYAITEISGNTLFIQPDLKILAYHWRRDIKSKQNVSRLVEDYNGYIVQPSLIFNYSDYQLQLGITRTLDNSMTIQPSSCIDRVTVKPKSANSWFTQGEYQFFKNDAYAASIWVSYKSYKMHASEVESGNTCFGTVGWHEPENSMQLWQLGAVFTF
ncbi:MAG: hypothetical protein V7765_04065 [Oleispira sp.]